MHGRRPIALASKTVTEADECALCRSVQPGESLDLPHRDASDTLRPFRGAFLKVGLRRRPEVGHAREIVTIRQSIPQQHMHHRAGKGAIGTRTEHQMLIGLFGGGVAVGIDHNDLGPTRLARLARLRDVGHHLHLGMHSVGAPQHDDIGVGDFQRRCSELFTYASDPSWIGGARAYAASLTAVAKDICQAINAVALNQTHGARIMVWPDSLIAVFGGNVQK